MANKAETAEKSELSKAIEKVLTGYYANVSLKGKDGKWKRVPVRIDVADSTKTVAVSLIVPKRTTGLFYGSESHRVHASWRIVRALNDYFEPGSRKAIEEIEVVEEEAE